MFFSSLSESLEIFINFRINPKRGILQFNWFRHFYSAKQCVALLIFFFTIRICQTCGKYDRTLHMCEKIGQMCHSGFSNDNVTPVTKNELYRHT